MTGRNGLIMVLSVIAACGFILALSAVVNGEMANLHLNMKADDELLPETKGDPEADPRTQQVEAEYDEFLPGSRTNRQWVDVGTWTTSAVNSDFSIDGWVEFNIWFQVYESGYDAEPDWEFNLTHNGELRMSVLEEDTDESTEEPIEVTGGATLGDPIVVQEGDTLSLIIRYQAWEDCDIYFDCAIYDSGVQMESDFLSLWDMEAGNDEVTIELYDPFDTDWDEVKSYFVLEIDDVEVDPKEISTGEGAEHDVNGKTVMGIEVSWELNEGFSGDEEVEAWLKYTQTRPTENRGLKETCVAKSGVEKKPVARIRNISPNPAEEEDEVTLDGRDSYDDDGSISRYVWKSDIDGELYNGSLEYFTTDTLTIGNHAISLVVCDDDDLWSSEVTEDLEVKEKPNNLPVISLLYPEDWAIFLFSGGSGLLDLGWEGFDADGDDLSYRVFTGDTSDPGVGGSLIEETKTTKSYMVEYEKEYRVYWKVVVSDGRDEVESDVWSFEVIAAEGEILQIDDPIEGQVVSDIIFIRGQAGESEEHIWDGEIEYIEVSIDGGMWYNATGTDQWEYSWDTSDGVSNGQHTISARAYDGGFYSNTMIVNVTVANDEAGGDDDDDDFEIAGMNGIYVIGAIVACVVVIAAAFIMTQRSYYDEDDEDYEYDEYGYDEDYDYSDEYL